MNKKQKKMLFRILLSTAATVILALLPLTGWIKLSAYILVYLFIGYDILADAFLGLIHGQLIDENFLMAVATLGAFALGIAFDGDYTEAIAVMLFYQIGELFQSYAIRKSRTSISALTRLRPDVAYVAEGSERREADPESVEPGTVIEIHPGERVPLDGVIVEGASQMDTSALTGESLPREAAIGDEVFSGCINLTGVLRVRTTKRADQSTAAKIMELVENAAARKSAPEKFISKFARIYTPAVCAAAVLLAVLPPLANALLLAHSPDWSVWLYRALTFLVISCPCALVISIPLSFFAGIGGAGRSGILVKGSTFLESLSRVYCAVFDKTGTLTKGEFVIDEIRSESKEESLLLEYAAHAQSASAHPIAKSILQAYGKAPDPGRVSEVNQIPGQGIVATVDGVRVAAGNEKLMAEEGIAFTPCDESATVVYLALDGQYEGCLLIRDQAKSTSRDAIGKLKALGIGKTVMLTGDGEKIAGRIARELGISEVHAGLLPHQKLEKLEDQLARIPKNKKLIFVGDGINDAPVLTRADVGIAMGAMGADAAIEAADVVIMDDDPKKVAQAIALAKSTLRIVYENIVFALAVKFFCLILGALGITNMWAAIFADVGVMVLAVLNSLRALKVKKI